MINPGFLWTNTYFNQTHDGTEGMIASSETWGNNYTARVKYTGNIWTPVSLGGGRTWAQLASTVEETRELNNSVVSTVNSNGTDLSLYG